MDFFECATFYGTTWNKLRAFKIQLKRIIFEFEIFWNQIKGACSQNIIKFNQLFGMFEMFQE